MPLLLFELTHSINCFFPREAAIKVVFSSFERSIIDYGKDVGVVAGSIDNLLPQGLVLIFREQQIINRVE